MTMLRTSLRGFFAHKGRMALSAVAVVLSVAFVCGTLVFTDTMGATFDKLFAATSADVTVSPKDAADDGETGPTGKPETLPASALAQVREADGVKAAEGAVVSTGVTVVDRDDKDMGSSTGAPTIAGNWTRNDRKAMDITSGHAPRGPTEMMVDRDTADKHGLRLGDELRTVSVFGDTKARITGIATFRVTNPGAAIVYFDTATAQRQLLGATGRFTQLTLDADAGFTHELLKKNAAAQLGKDAYTYRTQQEAADANRAEMGSFLDVMKYAMLGFAGIALLVGVFLIVNTFSMLVAQRTREIGLMRAIGSSRKQVNRSVLTEALLLGLFGSVLGVGAGVGLAVGLMKLMSGLGMKLDTSELTVAWTTPVLGLALGVLVTLLAAWLPARRAGQVSPMAALRDAGTPGDRKAGAVRAVLGVLLTGVGAGCLWAATQADETSAGGLYLAGGVLLTLVGFVIVGPVVAGFFVRALSAVVARPFGAMGRLSERNALRNPRRTGATGAALMIGLALVACLSVVGSSMIASATDQLDKSVGADFIIQSDKGEPVGPAVAAKVRATDGLARVTGYKEVEAKLTAPDGSRDDVRLSATQPSYMKDVRRETLAGSLPRAYERDAMSVGADWAAEHRVQVGDRLPVAFTHGRTAKLRVAAITKDEGQMLDKGAMYVSTATVGAYLPASRMPLDSMIIATAEEGRADTAYAALRSELRPYPQFKVRDQAEYKETLRDQVGQLLNMIYGLLALAIVVAVLGVVNTLALSVVERTREIGMMRAIGVSRRQLRRMIRLESVVIALFGALLGLGLGMAWGAAAQRLLAAEGFNTLSIPWPTITAVFAGAALVGLFAALIPAFRAARLNVLQAIATD